MWKANHNPTVLAQLADAIRRIEGGLGPPAGPHDIGTRRGSVRRIATGIDAIDAALPGGGLPGGALHALTGVGEGSGLWTWALWLARSAAQESRLIVWVNERGDFYPPAAWALGVAPRQLVLVRPRERNETYWVMDQALRCPGVAAVVGAPGRLSPSEARRLQLAAEAGGGMGLVIGRSDEATERRSDEGGRKSDGATITSPSPFVAPSLRRFVASSRWLIRPAVGEEVDDPPRAAVSTVRPEGRRRFVVELLQCRGGGAGTLVLLEVNHDANLVAVHGEGRHEGTEARRHEGRRGGRCGGTRESGMSASA